MWSGDLPLGDKLRILSSSVSCHVPLRPCSRDPAFIPDPSVRLVFKHQGGYATLERHPVDQSARSSSNGSSSGASTASAPPPAAAAAGAGATAAKSSGNRGNGGAEGGDLRSTVGPAGQESMQRSSYSADEPPRFVPYDGHVHGVVYRVTKEDFTKLAKREGGYVVEELEVSCLGLCIAVRAQCYLLVTPAVRHRTVVR